ncbi:hypothetical protein J6590_033991 [Homalodisca vitripennis]|nr:hypothetical protein J6590_033991 [Homalodisca vitripennis]
MSINNINKYFVKIGSACDVSQCVIDGFECNIRNDTENIFNFSPMSGRDVKFAMKEIKSKAIGSGRLFIQIIKAALTYQRKSSLKIEKQILYAEKLLRALKMSILILPTISKIKTTNS